MNEENVLSKRLRSLALAFFMVIGGGAFLTACDQGPAEEAGENIDEAAEEAGDAMDDAADEAEDAVE
ncbi:hypothetical protein [Marinimicrobium agarilyticum]|uniref:hypothetical protein n=1 Tax=Marinimicrobium agarilyticum TaxID=306546 RepID=UPI00041529BD|nr:hypothetical protein [Marinimicrobium agarilyticum]